MKSLLLLFLSTLLFSNAVFGQEEFITKDDSTCNQISAKMMSYINGFENKSPSEEEEEAIKEARRWMHHWKGITDVDGTIGGHLRE